MLLELFAVLTIVSLVYNAATGDGVNLRPRSTRDRSYAWTERR